MTENEYKDKVLDSTLSANARFVCLVLIQFRNRKSGGCFPSYETLAHSCNLCKNTIIKAIRELEYLGFVRIEKKRPKGARYTCNFYHFGFDSALREPSNEPSNERSPDAPKPIEPIYNKNVSFSEKKEEEKRYGGDTWETFTEQGKQDFKQDVGGMMSYAQKAMFRAFYVPDSEQERLVSR